MVIHISNRSMRGLDLPNPRPIYINALECIAHCRREGNHQVIGTEDVLNRIINIEGLSTVSERVYGVMRDEIPEKMRVGKHTSHVIRIKEPHSRINSRGNDPISIEIPLEHFANSTLVQPSILLLENSKDSNVYLQAAKRYGREHDLRSLLAFRLIQGGGDNTSSQFRSFQENHDRPVLCIVDTDKISPVDDIGQTAKNALDVNDRDRPLCFLYLVDAHEVENFIPIRILRKCTDKNTREREGVKSIELLTSNENTSDFRKYIDVKSGTHLREILDTLDDNHEIGIASLATVLQSIDNDCAESENCQNPESCKCTINHPVGDNNTDDAIDIIGESPVGYIDTRIETALSDIWTEVGRVTYSWLCSTMPLRS